MTDPLVPLIVGWNVIEVQNAEDVRVEYECVKVGTEDAPAEYTLTIYTHQPPVRPDCMAAIKAAALDEVQQLIQPGDDEWVDPPLPTQEQWDAIVKAAFPQGPMAGV